MSKWKELIVIMFKVRNDLFIASYSSIKNG